MSVCNLTVAGAAAGLLLHDGGGLLKQGLRRTHGVVLRSEITGLGGAVRMRDFGVGLSRTALGFSKKRRWNDGSGIRVTMTSSQPGSCEVYADRVDLNRKEQRRGTDSTHSLHRRIWRTSLRASNEEESKQDDDSATKKEEILTTETHDASAESSSGDSSKQSSEQAAEEEKVTLGSPLPGVKSSSEASRLPKQVIDTLRDQVFGFDTFFVTGQEPYEGGVLFKGNLRGEPEKSYTKLEKRLQDKFGDQYKLFLLTNPTDDRPVAVIVPRESLEPEPSVVPEWVAAGAFGLVCFFTILLRNAPALQLALLTNIADPGIITEALLGGSITAGVLLAHEAGHLYAAKEVGAKLSVPYFIPSWQLGSFGAITRITNIIRNRSGLLKLAAAGPLGGAFVGLIIVLTGLLLSPGEGQGIVVDAGAFHDSLLVGGLAKLVLGDKLQEGAKIAVNPIVLSAWAGLLINALNSIPVGELDGGRIVQALWGRKVWSRLTGVSVGLLGLTGIFNDVALYWVVLIVFLQRGPITPQSDELTPPDEKDLALGVAVLLLGLLVYLPFPWAFSYVLPPLA